MILIRGDGNARIGAGHLVRCMTIAEELAALRGSREAVLFVCADEESGKLVRENGFGSRVLGTDYRDMESELPLWQSLLGEELQDDSIIIVDSYYVTDRYLAALGRMAYTVLMDDFGVRRYPADCVVNYNGPADPEAYGRLYRGSGTRLLIGSAYVPLRRQFRAGAGQREAPEREPVGRSRPEYGTGGPAPEVRDVLITTGGGDSENIAGKILERIYREELVFHLVMGRFHPGFEEMRALETEYGNIQVHHDVKDMAGLMSRCQAALTAGGSTIYELAALGVPFICFSYAENQEALVEYIGEKHIAGSAGAWHKDPAGTLEKIGMLFEEMASDPEVRIRWGNGGRGMADGEGAERLARAICRYGGCSASKAKDRDAGQEAPGKAGELQETVESRQSGRKECFGE